MYAELDLKFKKPIDPVTARAEIIDIVGVNLIPVAQALQGSPLANEPTILASALAAEQVLNAATVVYFMEGNDSIKAHIVVRSLAEVRKQCSRITRQLSDKIPTLSEVNATVLVQVKGTDEAVLAGRRISFGKRMWETMAEKFAAKFVPAAVAFALAAKFLQGTTAFQSAAIGAAAACIGALFEAGVAARNSEDWKWKDLP